MKRTISLVLAGAVCLSLAGCGGTLAVSGGAPAAVSSAVSSAPPPPSAAIGVPLSSAPASSGIERLVSKGVDSVRLTLPPEFLGPTADEAVKEMRGKEGILSAEVNEDGSVTCVMTAEMHTQMLSEMKQNVEAAIAETVESGTFQSIRSAVFDSEMKVCTVTVDAKAFQNSLDAFGLLGLYLSSGLYQIFDGAQEEPTVIFWIVDAETGAEVETLVYPEDLNA